jgi:hypothetical protein
MGFIAQEVISHVPVFEPVKPIMGVLNLNKVLENAMSNCLGLPEGQL